MYDMVESGHKVQVEGECVTYTGGFAAHGMLSITLKALNLLIQPPVTGAEQAVPWPVGTTGWKERQDRMKH